MKNLTFIFLLILTGFVCLAQEQDSTQLINAETDSLILRLNSIESFVDTLKKESQDSKKLVKKELENKKDDIIKKQIEAVRICASYTDRFAQGTLAMDAILSAISSNVSLGQMSSPFVAPTFKKNYDNWISKWGKFLPAVIVPTLTLMTDNQNTQVLGVSVGIGLTALVSGLSKNGDASRNSDMTNAITNVTSTIELFDFNRMVYDDIEKLKAVIKSVESSDSTFSNEYIDYWGKNKDLLQMSGSAIKTDPRFKKYIENSTVYFDRFQLKLARVNYVLDYAFGMIQSYDQRYSYVTNLNLSSNPIFSETKDAIEDLEGQYDSFKVRWNTLQGKFYKLTPTETRKLNSFYQLEELSQNLN